MSSWFELSTTVACPHCDEETHVTPEFNMASGDRSGVKSGVYEEQCSNCDKIFFWNSYCSFEVEVESFKKDPSRKKKP